MGEWVQGVAKNFLIHTALANIESSSINCLFTASASESSVSAEDQLGSSFPGSTIVFCCMPDEDQLGSCVSGSAPDLHCTADASPGQGTSANLGVVNDEWCL